MFGQIEVEDAIAAPFFTIGTLVSTGLADITIFNTSLESVAFTLGGFDVAFSLLLTIGALALAAISNEVHKGSGSVLGSLDDEERYVVYAGAALIVGLQFFQPIQDAVIGNDALGVVVLAIEAATFYAISYIA
jgi:hypothetical protein